MTTGKIQRLLENALINDGEMRYELYEYELEELLDELKTSLAKDHDEYLFAITQNRNDVAMVLIEPPETVFINESARDRLKEHWKKAYSNNMKRLIPDFAAQLSDGQIPINGVKTIAARDA